MSQGRTSYTPSRLEWVALWANAALGRDAHEIRGFTIFFIAGGQGSNTLSIATSLNERGEEANLRSEFDKCAKELTRYAQEKRWDWLKIVHRLPALNLDKPSEGDQPYTPTRLEWLSVYANSIGVRDTWGKFGFELEFRPGPLGSNTLIYNISRDPRSDEQRIAPQLQSVTEAVIAVAKQKRWDAWLKIQNSTKFDDQARASEGDQPYQPTKVEWLAATANATLRTDAWDRDGIGIRFLGSATDPNMMTIHVTLASKGVDQVAVDEKIKHYLALIAMAGQQKNWKWLKVKAGDTTMQIARNDTPRASSSTTTQPDRPALPAITETPSTEPPTVAADGPQSSRPQSSLSRSFSELAPEVQTTTKPIGRAFIEVDIPQPTRPSPGPSVERGPLVEQPQASVRLTSLATAANALLAKNAWEADGYIVSIEALKPDSQTIYIVCYYDIKRVDQKLLDSHLLQARDTITALAKKQGWARGPNVEIDRHPIGETSDAVP